MGGEGWRSRRTYQRASPSRYFEATLNIICPPRVNVADLLLDIVGGDFPPDWREAHPTFHASDLFDLWEARLEERALLVSSGRTSSLNTCQKPPARDPAGFVRLVWLYLWRSVTQQMRHPIVAVINNALVFVAAIFLAIVYYGVSKRSANQATATTHCVPLFLQNPSYTPPEPIQAFASCPAQVAQGCQVHVP